MRPDTLQRMGKAALAAFLACLVAAPAGALDVDQDEALRLRQSGEVRSFAAILGVALERHPGARLLEAELEREDGELVYELELLTGDGVVREMDIDARSGEIIEDEVDD
ncbi:PepSY domain-containing protein [Alloalcanivorax profundimaris]|uniref:PepSY domain-containing protein n=1 Tax=Alloalcanivorax profundimaris TaxID=2735259 RepID=UPI001E5C3847|nr:PepSY domain-containing protein [Alloalcanivorax profundimaris]